MPMPNVLHVLPEQRSSRQRLRRGYIPRNHCRDKRGLASFGQKNIMERTTSNEPEQPSHSVAAAWGDNGVNDGGG